MKNPVNRKTKSKTSKSLSINYIITETTLIILLTMITLAKKLNLLMMNSLNKKKTQSLRSMLSQKFRSSSLSLKLTLKKIMMMTATMKMMMELKFKNSPQLLPVIEAELNLTGTSLLMMESTTSTITLTSTERTLKISSLSFPSDCYLTYWLLFAPKRLYRGVIYIIF